MLDVGQDQPFRRSIAPQLILSVPYGVASERSAELPNGSVSVAQEYR
jgi:hypothetical protein